MCKKVIKRDGRTVEFDHSKLYAALQNSFAAAGLKVQYAYCCRLASKIMNNTEEVITSEYIQEVVEKELFHDYPQVYAIYHECALDRSRARCSKHFAVFRDIVDVKATDVIRENGNMNADTPSGMMYKFASEASKEFTIQELVPERFAKAHKAGVIHIHDLDYYPTRSLTCIQHPLDRILQSGFVAGHGESRPSKRIETASILGCISMETVQNEMHGGQSIPAFDFYLAPYVRRTFHEEIDKLSTLLGRPLTHLYDVKISDYIKKDLQAYDKVRMTDHRLVQMAINSTVDRVYQAMEAFVHNMNTIHSRGGNQVVFSSINYGTDISAEGRCVIRELLKTTYSGIGAGKTAIFPIQIWKLKSGVSYKPGDPNYDLFCYACEVAAKRFFPNFINLDAPFNQHELWLKDDPERYKYEVATMGCHPADTEIVMFDGTLKKVQDIKVGDVVMGENGVPRTVVTLVNGSGTMYKVEQSNGDNYTVNGDHILSLLHTTEEVVGGWDPSRVVNMSVTDYLALTVDEQAEYRGYKGCIASSKGMYKTSELTITELSEDDYYGFELDGLVQLYMLADGTVTHNCRTRVFENRFGVKTSIGRGNLSFTTINLPRIAIQIARDTTIDPADYKKELIKRTLKVVELAGEQLDERFKFQAKALKKQFPLLMSGLWEGSATLGENDTIESVINQGTLSIGFIGLAECLVALFGHHHAEDEECQAIGLSLIKAMRDKANELSVKLKHNYAILATPAEGLSGRFTRLDKAEFGVIPGVTDREFYTNSNHVPVYYHCTAKHKAEIECPYHDLTRAGSIFYVEQDGDPSNNVEAIHKFIEIFHANNGGYLSINFNQNVCNSCGHEWNGKDEECPKCHSKDIDTLARITGYLSTSTKRWNKAKLAELRARVGHKV